ncbi:serine/threonine-protein kinase [Streptomyces sp. V2I9]|uniref:serine/threonine-protein kinase n=1 Tax=Streptomyces sp. V2I9 TaxID=3042304 RepID=UPI00278840A4|nr:serine/threonine-protein kinase [Streptomyces sp. V2I9]MDQ0987963.1 serine/threonine protein kinase [Streptomyces sp. V2I9]
MAMSELLEPQGTGPFRTVAVLGEGGMGRVLLGVSPDGRLVAVKQVHADLADDDGFRARFRREVAASRRVSGAYTAPVLDADAEAPVPWLASAFVPGPSLSQALEAVRTLPAPSVRQLAAGLAQALADIHRAGLIHRDLKPSNVLLAEDGVRVIDFGIARAAEGQTALTHAGAVLGSPPFMSPEQVHGRAPTPASDVFSLGATLFTACTGLPPFHADSVPGILYKVAHSDPDLSALPPELHEIIAPCLSKEEGDRPSPAELLALIGTVAPTARPWPAEVHRITAAQRTEIDRLVSLPDRTTSISPAPRTQPPPPGFAPPAAVGSAAEHGSSRRGRTLGLVVGGVLVAAAVTAAALLLPQGEDPKGKPTRAAAERTPSPDTTWNVPTPGTTPLSKVPDKHPTDLPNCAKRSSPVRVPSLFDAPTGPTKEQTHHDPDAHELMSWCTWNSRSGDEINVSWKRYGSHPEEGTGAEQAKKYYEGFFYPGHGRREDIGLGEEALWVTDDDRNNCLLYVRDVNLVVITSVSGRAHPPGTCEKLTTDVTGDALSAVTS